MTAGALAIRSTVGQLLSNSRYHSGVQPTTPNVYADADTRTRILRAAIEWANDTGMRKVSMPEVAKRAGLSRATLYLYFPNKQALFDAAVALQIEELFLGVAAVAMDHPDDDDERLVHTFGYAYRWLRDNPTLNAVMRMNPELLMPYVSGENSAIIRSVEYAAPLIGAAELHGVTPEEFAEIVVRTFHTLILAPSKVFDLEREGGPEDYARRFLVPIKNAPA